MAQLVPRSLPLYILGFHPWYACADRNMSRISLFSALGNFFGAFTIYHNERDIQAIEDQQFDDSRRNLMDLSAEDSDREYLRKLRFLARGPRRPHR